MSGESYVGLGALLLAPAVLPLALAAAGVGLAGAAVYGSAKLAHEAYDEHKRKLTEQYGIEKEQLEALDRAVNDIARARESLASKIRQQVCREQQEVVIATGFGQLAASMAGIASEEEVSGNSASSNVADAGEIEGSIDFSDLFASDIASASAEAKTLQEYLSMIEKRVSGLVAFTSEERGVQDRLLQRCAGVADSEMTIADARQLFDKQVDDLCARLCEGEGERRRAAYLDYIALCNLSKEQPKELSYEAMVSRTSELSESYLKSHVQDEVFSTVTTSLAEVGLENLGLVSFDGEDGYLLVDGTDNTCGIFLRKSEDSEAFLFTTVSAQEPSRVSVAEKNRILSSAKNLCDKKRVLFDELLPNKGIAVDVEYEYDPPSLDHIHKLQPFADYVQSSKEETRGAQVSTDEVKYQEN